MGHAIHALLLDHDGTLVDSEGVHLRLWQQLLAEHDVILAEDIYKTHYAGLPSAQSAVDMVARFALPTSALELAARKVAATSAYLVQQPFPLMPGAQEVITGLRRQGFTLAVVTGGKTYQVQRTIEAYGFEDCFATIVSADDVVRNKPAPDVYQCALQRLGLEAAQCLAVEDTSHGVHAAALAGITCVAVPNPLSLLHDFSMACALLTSLLDLPLWLAEHGIAPPPSRRV